MERIRAITSDVNYLVRPGDHFNLVLPDGTVLNVEQTADDFSIVRQNGMVAYTKPTSQHAKETDAESRGVEETTGRN